MNFTFLDNLQIIPGFYPVASLLAGAVLYFLYRLFIRMHCQSRQAQMLLTLGMCLMTATLFFRLTVWVETPATVSVIRQAVSSVATDAHSLSAGEFITDGGTRFLENAEATLQEQALPATVSEDRFRPAEKILGVLTAAWDYVQSHLFVIYGAGIVLLFFYMMVQIGQLYYIRRKSMLQGYRGCIRIYRSPCTAPFSYGYNIFLPYNMKDGQQDFVLAHEENHIWHRHFHKLLFLQCLTIVNWFNPFAYLLFRAIKELQEMEVDRDVLNNGFDREQYQLNLVLTCTAHQEWVWARSNYNYSSLKERILFMNRHIRNSKSWLLVLVSGFGFLGFTSMITVQEVERQAEDTENTVDFALERPESSTGQTLQASVTETDKQVSETDSASSESTARPSRKKEYDSRGCWIMLFIGDSAYQHHKKLPFVKHYKFFGDKASLTLTVNWKTPDGAMAIGGATGDYDPFSETLVREGGQVRPRQWIDSNHIDDTWKDVYNISSFIPSLWKTECWERCAVPEEVKRTADAYKQCQERKDRLKGVWKLVISDPKVESYKFFGKNRFFSVNLRPYERENLFYTFSGSAGDFAYINDTTVIEGQQSYNLNWRNKETFSYQTLNGKILTYVRVKMPQVVKQVLEGCGLQ
jgi:beta-lactamase regulating signal transducer with metallopeptidase domain